MGMVLVLKAVILCCSHTLVPHFAPSMLDLQLGGGRLAADLLLPSPALPLWELRFICLFITYHIPIALHGTPAYQYMASDIKNVSRSSPLPILERPG